MSKIEFLNNESILKIKCDENESQVKIETIDAITADDEGVILVLRNGKILKVDQSACASVGELASLIWGDE